MSEMDYSKAYHIKFEEKIVPSPGPWDSDTYHITLTCQEITGEK